MAWKDTAATLYSTIDTECIVLDEPLDDLESMRVVGWTWWLVVAWLDDATLWKNAMASSCNVVKSVG